MLLLPLLAIGGTILYEGLKYEVNTSNHTASVAEQGRNAVSGDITIPSSITYDGTYTVTSIGRYAFGFCENLTSITIPNSVTSIGDCAFKDCSGLTSVTIPNSVTSIGNEAFCECTGLTSITIPNSVTSIGNDAFADCSGLTSISIPNSVTSIGGGAFGWCENLTSITIPSSVTSIGDRVFCACTGLQSITIPNSVTSIGRDAFYRCTGLTSITIPNSVTSIGEAAFKGCINLSSITVENGNTVYDSRYNCNAIIETASNTLIAGCKNSVIPKTVTSIGDRAFNSCESLTSIDIPNSVTSIGFMAFDGCDGLSSVTIGNSVKSIGKWAFYGCFAINTITLAWTDPSACTYGEEMLLEVPTSAKLYVPEGTKSLYQATAPWSSFSNIVEYELTGIQQHTLQADNPISACYNTSGQRIKEPQKGQVVVVRYTDGTTRKVLVK